MNTRKANVGTVKMIAHRGCSGLETENSLPAFLAAGNRSFWGIETDIHFTADGKCVIMHDSNTARTGDRELEIEDSTFEQVRAVQLKDMGGEAGRKDLFIPTLAEYIAVCRRYEKTAVVEIKMPLSVERMDEVMEIIGDYAPHTVIISFHYVALQNLRVHHPHQKAQFLCGACDDALLDQMKNDGFGLDIHYAVVDEGVIRRCKQRGIEINVWTVDSPEDCERLANMGVDYITSNICEDVLLAAKE